MFKLYSEVFKNKYFKYLWASQILSQITINIMNFSLLLRIFEKTGSSIATSLLWVAYALPAVFFGPIGSTSTDLISKRKLLIITNLLQCLTILIYSFLHESSFFLMYFVVLAYSFLNQFYVPSEAATLPYLVKVSDLPIANGLFFITQQMSLIIGFGIAGLLLKIMGFNNILFLCSIMLFFAFVSCLFLPEIKYKKLLEKDFIYSVTGFFKRIIEGYKYIKSDKYIIAPLFLLMVIQVSLAIIIVNVPSIATNIFSISLDKAGIVIVVPASLGALFGALLVPKILKDGKRKIKVIEDSILSLIIALGAIIFFLPIIGLVNRIIIGSILISVVGLTFMGIFIPSQTFLQEITPKDFRGRVFGNYWFIVTIVSIFPVLVSGTISELLGIKTFLFFLGISYALIFYLIRKKESFYFK